MRPVSFGALEMPRFEAFEFVGQLIDRRKGILEDSLQEAVRWRQVVRTGRI